MGFYPPSEGKISIDGYNLNLIDKGLLSRADRLCGCKAICCFLAPSPENIALGESNPDRRRIVEVARLADAHGFISQQAAARLRTDRGRARRRFVGRSNSAALHCPLLVRGPSAVDLRRSHLGPRHAIRDQHPSEPVGVLEGCTALVIAHRLSTIMNADKILVLYQGRIVEEGTHQTLFDRQGMYHQLIHKQLAAAA